MKKELVLEPGDLVKFKFTHWLLVLSVVRLRESEYEIDVVVLTSDCQRSRWTYDTNSLKKATIQKPNEI